MSLVGSIGLQKDTAAAQAVIDWLTARIPCQHQDAIDGGMVFSIDRNGDVDWQTRKRLSVEGSCSSKVQIRTEDQDHLDITGNPSKFLQGHNLFGSNNFLSLTNQFFASALSSIDLPVTEQNGLDWQNGEYQILRVDIAESFRLPCPADVDTWIRAASQLVKGKGTQNRCRSSDRKYAANSYSSNSFTKGIRSGTGSFL